MRSLHHIRGSALVAATTLLAIGLSGCKDGDDPAVVAEDAAEESADAIEDAVDDAVDESGG